MNAAGTQPVWVSIPGGGVFHDKDATLLIDGNTSCDYITVALVDGEDDLKVRLIAEDLPGLADALKRAYERMRKNG